MFIKPNNSYRFAPALQKAGALSKAAVFAMKLKLVAV